MKKKSSDKWQKFDSIKEKDIDFTDIPKLSKTIFKNMKLVYPEPKKSISIRVDNDVLTYFKKYGPGYQTKINAVLKGYVTANQA